jgi:hypothetical protein
MDPLALKPLYDALQRYAGWLDRDRTSVIVRADVVALGLAFDTNGDPLPCLQTLETDLARLPSGELRTMMRKTSAKIRRAFEVLP